MAIPSRIYATKSYRVKLARVVEIDKLKIRPLSVQTMTGAFLKRVIAQDGEEAIIDAAPVPN